MGRPRPTINITTSTHIHGKKALLSIWWDRKGAVYYELLKLGEQVTGDRYRQLIKLNQAF